MTWWFITKYYSLVAIQSTYASEAAIWRLLLLRHSLRWGILHNLPLKFILLSANHLVYYRSFFQQNKGRHCLHFKSSWHVLLYKEDNFSLASLSQFLLQCTDRQITVSKGSHLAIFDPNISSKQLLGKIIPPYASGIEAKKQICH